MSEQPKKVYTLEDNIKSIFFQNKEILKAIQELMEMVKNSKNDSSRF